MITPITVQQSVEIARAFSAGIPAQASRISLTSNDALNLNFILTLDDDTFPVSLPYPRLAIFDQKGAPIVSIPFVPGTTGWQMELPGSGLISWHLSGDNNGFDSIRSLHPTQLQYRILGLFGGRREITLLQGDCVYTRAPEDLVPETIDQDEEIGSALEMFLQFQGQYQYFYTEYIWSDQTGELDVKNHYDNPNKTTLLFTSQYEWDNDTGLLDTKTITRYSDSQQLILHYNWNLDGVLESVARTAV